jgi:hypothetical protein
MQSNMAAGVPEVGKHTFSFRIALAGLTNADILTSFVPGFKFAIEKVMFAVQAAVTTAAKLATITPKIDAVDITGGVLALTSANCTPKGTVLTGTAVTGANDDNLGSDTSAITLTASAVTAFVEGDGELIIILRNREVGIP